MKPQQRARGGPGNLFLRYSSGLGEVLLLVCGAEAREPALGGGGEGDTWCSSRQMDRQMDGWCPRGGHASAPRAQAVRPQPWPRSTLQAGVQPPQHDLGSRKGSAWQFISLLPPTSHKAATYPPWEQPLRWESGPACTCQSTSKVRRLLVQKKEERRKEGKKKELNRRMREIKREQDALET